MSNDPTCGVCGGKKSNHFADNGQPTTQHVFSESGQLQTQAEAAEAKATPRTSMGPLGMLGANAGNSVGRLAEVLVARGVITEQDALYVAGMSQTYPKPEVRQG